MELRRLRHPGLAGPLSTTRAVAALAVLTVLRLVVAGLAPLSPDEAYYWVWSHALAAGYPDHPPMVALWIRAGTALAGQGALGVRLLGPLSAALGSVLLADAARLLLPGERPGEGPGVGRGAGIGAAVALNATLMFAAGAVIMTPDTPLLFFWTATVWALARFAAPGASDRARILWLLGAGLAVGLAACSKYTAAFLGLGAGAWFVLVPGLRPWLRRPWPWLAALLAACVFAPVLWWNAAHGWTSLLRQGGRVGQFAPARAAQFLGELIVGQLGLATPLLAVLFAAGLVLALRRASVGRAPGWTLLVLLSWPPLAVFVEHTLGDRVQGNWPAIVYPAAAIAALGLRAPVWARLRPFAVALGYLMGAVIYVQAAVAPFALPPRLDPSMRQLAGWRGLALQAELARRRAGAAFLAADDYGTASELAHLLPGTAVLGADARWALFALPHPDLAGQAGLLLRSGRHLDPPDPRLWRSVTAVGTLLRGRAGIVAETFRLYRVVGQAALPAVARLPARLPAPLAAPLPEALVR